MIRVQIGTDERSDQNISESWIAQQINRRRQQGEPVCLRVQINSSSLNIHLASASCASTGGGGGGRPPSPHELDVFGLWEKHGLHEPSFTGGNVIAFLKQLERHL